ncbi:MAG: hypothetical protein M0019_08720 [Actinomycetota bacterium]|nr:hypothetical protein [Actinomycetota bacterium]
MAAKPRVKFAITALAIAFTASSCGASAASNGTKACGYVNRGLSIYAKNHANASQALNEIRQALPYAAIAAGTDGSWQPLEATLSETNRVPLSDLTSALSQECQGGGGNPNNGGVFEQATIPPGNGG